MSASSQSQSGSFSRAVGGRINATGARFMFAKSTRALMTGLGINNPIAAYVCGRGGVLGDVAAEVVESAFGFMHPEMIATNWAEGTAIASARSASDAYREGCFVFGRETLGDIDGIDEFAALAERVIDAAPLAGLALFAGWKAEPRPSDGPARAALALQTLRELRGSAHLVGIVAVGLEPKLAAAVKSPGNLKMFGWGELTADGASLQPQLDAAEDITDVIVGPAFATLSSTEQARFDAVLTAIADKLNNS
ncbi:MAG: hypothetical protein AB7V43_02250 [Acidimicrobiia bacterium]